MDVIIVTMLFGVLGIVIGWKVGSVWGSLAETDRQYWMRNLAVVLETAAINNRQKKMGYNAAKELLIRLGLNDTMD